MMAKTVIAQFYSLKALSDQILWELKTCTTIVQTDDLSS